MCKLKKLSNTKREDAADDEASEGEEEEAGEKLPDANGKPVKKGKKCGASTMDAEAETAAAAVTGTFSIIVQSWNSLSYFPHSSAALPNCC